MVGHQRDGPVEVMRLREVDAEVSEQSLEGLLDGLLRADTSGLFDPDVAVEDGGRDSQIVRRVGQPAQRCVCSLLSVSHDGGPEPFASSG